MYSWWQYSSTSSVVIPGRRYSPVRRRISAATLPAWRMRSIVSGVLMRGSSQWTGMPDSAYGGRAMWSGTVRIGDTAPCSTRPSERLWQRLYLRPLPHQQGSFACGSRAGASTTDRIRQPIVRPIGTAWNRGKWQTERAGQSQIIDRTKPVAIARWASARAQRAAELEGE